MTEALFRDDPYLDRCVARVVEAGPGGVVLDRTVFYAEGGGQPGDRGKLTLADGSAVAVVDTRRREDGSIVHVLADAAALPAANAEVSADIDWAYRYRHMRTHTRLHLLCALVPHEVTGGSISQDKGRLDFDMAIAFYVLHLHSSR